MRIAIGTDHAGFPLRDTVLRVIGETGNDALDLGAHEYEATDDYPDRAAPVAAAVASGRADRGIVVCGSGIGASITANKYRGVRASVCHDAFSAAQGVEHDDMNVLCIGARVIGTAIAESVIKSFIDADLVEEPRFLRRLDKLIAIENANFDTSRP